MEQSNSDINIMAHCSNLSFITTSWVFAVRWGLNGHTAKSNQLQHFKTGILMTLNIQWTECSLQLFYHCHLKLLVERQKGHLTGKTSIDVLCIRNCRAYSEPMTSHVLSRLADSRWTHESMTPRKRSTASIGAYLLLEQSFQTTSRSHLKRRSLTLFWRGSLQQKYMGSVPDAKTAQGVGSFSIWDLAWQEVGWLGRNVNKT